MIKYLDTSGLQYFWQKVKEYIDTKVATVSTGSIIPRTTKIPTTREIYVDEADVGEFSITHTNMTYDATTDTWKNLSGVDGSLKITCTKAGVIVLHCLTPNIGNCYLRITRGGVEVFNNWENFVNLSRTYPHKYEFKVGDFYNLSTVVKNYEFKVYGEPKLNLTWASNVGNVVITSGSGTADTTALGSLIYVASQKTAPIDNDMFALMDSANGNIVKKFSWSSLKTSIKTYLDTLYSSTSHTHPNDHTSTLVGTKTLIEGSPTNGQVLTYNGTNIVYSTPTGGGGSVINDTSASTTTTYSSTKINSLISSSGGGDMLKSTYDNDGDGKVNSAVVADSANSVDWVNITSKPSSTTANIDNAVTNSHTHNNKTLLDTYTQTDANLTSAVILKHSNANDHASTLIGTKTLVEGTPTSGQVLTYNGTNVVYATPTGGSGTQGKGYNPRGEWLTNTAYVNNTTTIDVVYYMGSSYYCKVSTNGSLSSPLIDTTTWGLLAKVGMDGMSGSSGKTAYQSAVSGGFTGTESQFNAVLNVGIGTAISGTTGTLTVTMNGNLKTLTPTGACTLNADTGGLAGQEITFILIADSTTARVITFGTNFKSAGTISTATTSGKAVTITFISNGTSWYENQRITTGL